MVSLGAVKAHVLRFMLRTAWQAVSHIGKPAAEASAPVLERGTAQASGRVLMSHAAEPCCTRPLMGEQCCFGAIEKGAAW